MHDTAELKKLLDKSKQAYQAAMDALSDKTLTEPEWNATAQKANDAYLEYKRMDDVVTNCLITKKLGDLYGC